MPPANYTPPTKLLFDRKTIEKLIEAEAMVRLPDWPELPKSLRGKIFPATKLQSMLTTAISMMDEYVTYDSLLKQKETSIDVLCGSVSLEIFFADQTIDLASEAETIWWEAETLMRAIGKAVVVN